MLLPIMCGIVGTVALYRSLCQPSFLCSRLLIWIAFGSTYVFEAFRGMLCDELKMIATEQCIAAIFLAGAIILFGISREIRVVAVPLRFGFEQIDDPGALPLVLCWICLFGSIAFSIHVYCMLQV